MSGLRGWFCTGCGSVVAVEPTMDDRYGIGHCPACRGKRPAVRDHDRALQLAAEAARAADARKAAKA